VNGVDFTLAEGATLCLLGESGSGKTMILRALMRLLPPTARLGGRILVGGVDMLALAPAALASVRGALLSMIFQEPMTALDPVFTIGQQIGETVRRHDKVGPRAARLRARELLDLVQIPSAERRLDAYPHELSGGLRQRAMIALALSCRPRLLLADEPTTALDVTVQIQIMLLLRSLQRELGMATIFVTHDLGRRLRGRRPGRRDLCRTIRRDGPVGAVLSRPSHPYNRGTAALDGAGAPPPRAAAAHRRGAALSRGACRPAAASCRAAIMPKRDAANGCRISPLAAPDRSVRCVRA